MDANDILMNGGPEALRKAFDNSSVPPVGNHNDPNKLRKRGFKSVCSEQIKPYKWRIKDTLPEQGSGLFGGQSGAGKSTAATDLAVALATGSDFLGRKVREPCGTVYFAAEGGSGIPVRVTASIRHRGVTESIPFYYKTEVDNLMKPDEVAKLIADIKMIDASFKEKFGVPVGLVIVDTVGAAFHMRDENDNAEVAGVCRTLNKIASETKTVALGVHHFGKNAESSFRGASYWRGGVDIGFAVLADREELAGESRNRRISMNKNRDGPEGPIGSFDLKFIELGVDDYGDPYGACAVEPTEDVRPCTATKKIPKSRQVFHDAFNEVLLEHGESHIVRGDGPTVKAVPIELIREEYELRYATGESDPKKRKKNTHTAFKRSLDDLSMTQYATETKGDTEWIWRL